MTEGFCGQIVVDPIHKSLDIGISYRRCITVPENVTEVFVNFIHVRNFMCSQFRINCYTYGPDRLTGKGMKCADCPYSLGLAPVAKFKPVSTGQLSNLNVICIPDLTTTVQCVVKSVRYDLASLHLLWLVCLCFLPQLHAIRAANACV